ncbi:hypothetical protein PMAYCL1PPCAC_16955 [Pristionchus mayeri]|uniref:Cytochrome P450 n=1 Tax=Pristionchus mayeri TaxID=1317129 RepID=A0AAN5CLQ2_9BILA|nr:hypothetical protein PMAYCL1PPCAC_16955 [Pristionchus mayeri]
MFLAVLIAIAFIFLLTFVVPWRKMGDMSKMIWRAYINLAKIPGPKSYPIVGSVWQFKLNSSDFAVQMSGFQQLYAFAEGSPGIVKMWFGPVPIAIVVRPEYCKLLLESSTLITKATFYDKLSEWIGTGLLTSTNEKWFGRRKLLTPAFHFNVLKGYQDIFVKQAQVFLEQIDAYADSGREVDLFPYVKRCALDIICDTAMSTQLNAQIGKNSEYVQAVTRLSDMLFNYERSPWLWLKPIWYASGLGFEFDRLVKMTTDFTRQVIAERRAILMDEGRFGESASLGTKKMAFLDLMLLNQSENGLSDEDIREEVDTFMFEGHDTTSSGMGWTIWLLGQHPQYQTRVHEEMDVVFGDSDREPTEADLKKCVFLDQCIKESLRLCPPVPIIARRLTHDISLGGCTLPKDLTVFLVPMGTHRDPKEWERPAEFYPDHFLPDAVAKRHPFAYFPFSAGPRNCIGQKFAQAEEKTVLSYFFRKYRVESSTPSPGNRFVPELILKPEEGVICRMYKRER